MADSAAPAEISDTPDFRQYESLFAEHAKEISSFPNEVLSVNEEKKQLRALDRTLFEDTAANYGFVAFSKSYLAQEWSVMGTKGETTKLKTKTAIASKLPEQSFEVDESMLTTSSSEIQDVTLQRWMNEESETSIETTPIMPLANEAAAPSMIQAIPQAHPYQERLGDEVAIEAQELTFAFGAYEPFFCALALYDAKEQRKISEDYHFQINTPEQLAMVGVTPELLTPTVVSKRAVFRLSPTSKHADIYVFLTVSKVLSGELDETYEMYGKTSWKDKELKKAVTSIHETCGRLSKFRQVFAWGAAPVFEPDGSYKSESIYAMELSRIKTDMWSLIDEVKEGKKIKAIPGTFKFFMTIKPNPTQFCNRLTPSLAPVQPFDASVAGRTKEIQEFTSTNEYPYPWVNYVNNYYLYLQKADLSSLSGRNICIEVKVMDNDSDPDGPGMLVIYADSVTSSGPLVDRYTSTVTYHSQVPKLLDEVAIKLPTQVTDKHHLLVSFYHINVAVKKNDELKTLVARTFIPLLKDHQIIRQKNVIRIASKLSPGYMTKEESVSWIDNKKAALTMYARVISSVYPLEGALHKFLRTCEWDSKSDWTKIIAAMKGLFDEKTNRRQTVRYLPVVMRTLFQHLMSNTMALSREAFDTLLAVLESVSTLTKPEDGILEAYVTYVFNAEANQSRPGSSQLYEKIIEQWMNVLNEKHEVSAIPSLKYAWFLISVSLKSMLFTLASDDASSTGNGSNGSLSAATASSSGDEAANIKHTRKTSTAESKARLEMKIESKGSDGSVFKRLGADWVRLMSNFAKACGDFVRENYKNMGYATHLPAFHVQLARLMGETAPLMDKGASFEIIWDYFGKLNLANIDMFTFKALMLKVFSQRVDFAALNIPALPSFTSVRDLPRIFLQRHFLVGLLLKQVEFAYVTNNPTIRMLVLDLLADSIYTHEMDPKLSTKQRTKILQTYFPFVLMVIDRFEILKLAPEDERAKSYAVLLAILRNMTSTFLASYWRKEAERRIFTLFEILKSIVDQFEWIGLEDMAEYHRTHQTVANPRFSLVALGGGVVDGDDTVVTSDSRGQLARQASIGPARSPVLKERKKKAPTSVTSSATSTTGHSKTSSTSSSGGVSSLNLPPPLTTPTPAGSGASLPLPLADPSAASDYIAATKGSSSATSTKDSAKDSALSPRKDASTSSTSIGPKDSIVSPRKESNASAAALRKPVTRPKESKRSMKTGHTGTSKEVLLQCSSALSFQTGVAVLDVLNTFITQFDVAMQRRDVFEQAFEVLIHLFRRNQSTSFLSLLQKKLYFLVAKFGVRLFQKRNSVCGDLVTEVLNKCNSRILLTRSEAATLLAQIFKVNHKIAGNVDRSRLQATIGITKLVGQTTSESFGRLFRSFAALSKYFAGEERSIGTVVDQLEAKIRAIITDNLKIQQFGYDPETIVDLYYGISKQLLDHPDERITWLDNLAEYHKSLGQLEESAQTKILTAALVQQYLSALDRWEAKMVPVFGLVCPSVQEEIEMPHVSALMTLKDEVCQASVFSSHGFAELIKEAITMLKNAGLLELAVAAYRMLLPIYQMSEDYKMQQMCHGDLYTLTGQLNDETQMKQRIFSNYYRVSIYCAKLGADLNGQTFIYREKNICRLAEFTERLRTQYGRAIGDYANVVIVPNAQVVNRAELDESKCYLQVAPVELFLTPDQQAERSTPFKQHFGANRFVMEQPFAKNTTKQQTQSIEDQWLRRTIYTTSRAFPFASKRLKVTSSEDQELSPIQYAEALISKKVAQLRSEMSIATPNLKTLQRELQGTLLTQVNAGAGAIIQAFLSNEAADKYPQEQREKLADITIEFDRALIFAVKLNKKFMEPTADQTLLQEELEKGHQKFHASLDACEIIPSRHASRHKMAAEAQQVQAALANKKLDANAPKKTRSSLLEPIGAAPVSSSSSPAIAPSSKPSTRTINKSGK